MNTKPAIRASKAVRKNSPLEKKIINGITYAKAYRFNDSSGQDYTEVPAERIKFIQDEFNKHRANGDSYPQLVIREDAPGAGTIRYHSNMWYDILFDKAVLGPDKAVADGQSGSGGKMEINSGKEKVEKRIFNPGPGEDAAFGEKPVDAVPFDRILKLIEDKDIETLEKELGARKKGWPVTEAERAAVLKIADALDSEALALTEKWKSSGHKDRESLKKSVEIGKEVFRWRRLLDMHGSLKATESVERRVFKPGPGEDEGLDCQMCGKVFKPGDTVVIEHEPGGTPSGQVEYCEACYDKTQGSGLKAGAGEELIAAAEAARLAKAKSPTQASGKGSISEIFEGGPVGDRRWFIRVWYNGSQGSGKVLQEDFETYEAADEFRKSIPELNAGIRAEYDLTPSYGRFKSLGSLGYLTLNGIENPGATQPGGMDLSSYALHRSNYEAVALALPEGGEEGQADFMASHPGTEYPGDVVYKNNGIHIYSGAHTAVDKAKALIAQLENYPALNDEAMSAIELEEYQSTANFELRTVMRELGFYKPVDAVLTDGEAEGLIALEASDKEAHDAILEGVDKILDGDGHEAAIERALVQCYVENGGTTWDKDMLVEKLGFAPDPEAEAHAFVAAELKRHAAGHTPGTEEYQQIVENEGQMRLMESLRAGIAAARCAVYGLQALRRLAAEADGGDTETPAPDAAAPVVVPVATPVTRLAEVMNTGDQDKLAAFAKTDAEKFVRAAASKRITDAKHLIDFVATSSDFDLAFEALTRLEDPAAKTEALAARKANNPMAFRMAIAARG